MSCKKFGLLGAFTVALLGLGIGCQQEQNSLDVWNVSGSKWDQKAEREFSRFVTKIGEGRKASKCQKLGECLQNPDVNPYYDDRDDHVDLFADCADLPLIMRAYFAFKTSRPFGWVKSIDGGRYTAGNQPITSLDQASVPTLNDLFKSIAGTSHTGMLRMEAGMENTDTYPIEISRKSLRPGTIYYDPNGHVLIVYKVSRDGTIHMLDGHPDNSLTLQVFSSKFRRGSASNGGGFRNFRPFLSDDSPNGKWVENNKLKDHSETSQYRKSYWVGETKVDYYEWVKATLSGTKRVSYSPVKDIKMKTLSICEQIGERVKAVELATSKGIHDLVHPGFLPGNIFGAEGLWETYSTPGRDARLKASFREAYRYIQNIVRLKNTNSKAVVYDGDLRSLLTDMRSAIALALTSDSCRNFAYKNSYMERVPLNFEIIEKRLYRMSFDPYHCPELRWGAAFDTFELNSCQDQAEKFDWYLREERLRYIIDRDMSKPTDPEYGPSYGTKIGYLGLIDEMLEIN